MEKDFRTIGNNIKPVASYVDPLKILLYGKPGTGKTTLACSAPGPILLIDCSEKGTDSVKEIPNLFVLRVQEGGEIEQIYWYIKKNPHKYKTIIIDTVTHAQDLAILKVLESSNKEVDKTSLGSWGSMTQSDWGKVSTLVKSLIHNFRDLPENIIFLAHERVFNQVEEEDTSDDNKISPSVGPQLTKSTGNTLCAAVNIIANTFIQERVTKTRDKLTKELIKKKEMKYCLRIGPDSIYITKVRKPKKFLVPRYLIDPSYAKIMSILKGTAE